MKRPDVCVAVTGFGGLDRPDSGSAVARALKKGWYGNITIAALGYHPFMTEAWTPDTVDHLHILPHPENGDDAVLERVLELNSQYEISVLIPCADIDIPVFCRLSSRLATNGIRTLLPGPDRVRAISKQDLVRFNYKHNISAPRSIFVQKVSDVPLYADQLGYPLIIKGHCSSKKTAYTAQQAIAEATSLDSNSGKGVVLQQFIRGEEYAVAAIVGRDGKCKQSVTMRKLAINQSGLDVCGSVVDDPYINEYADELIEKLDWCGPLELELVRTENSTESYLCDITYCFPSWIMLTHWAKRNLPVLLLEELTGLNGVKKNQDYQLGSIFIRSIKETVVPLNKLKQLKRFGSADFNKQRISEEYPSKCGSVESIGIRVAITGTSTYDMINPGLGVARALRKIPGVSKIYSLNYGTFDSGAYQANLFDAAFQLPIANEKNVLFERLCEIHKKHPFDVLIPCLDGELINFIDNQESLRDLGVRTLLPTREAFNKRSKLQIFGGEALMDYGWFKVPESHIVESESEFIRTIELIGIPSVIKGPISGCLQINHASDAMPAWDRLMAQGLEQIIVQPRIAGSMYAIAAVCDRKSEVIASVTIRKLLNCEKGSTWSAMQVRLPELENAFARYLAEIGWIGPAEGEFIRDNVEDRFYLIEVNPRFTGWISYTEALGLNHPYIAVCTALDNGFCIDKDQTQMREDLVFMRSNDELEVRPMDLASFAMKGYVQNGKK